MLADDGELVRPRYPARSHRSANGRYPPKGEVAGMQNVWVAVDPERALKIDVMNGRYARKRSSAEGEGCVHQGDVVEEGDGDLMGDG
jgi:hypothetical protein